MQLSYAQSQQQALDGAYDQWRTNVFQGSVLGDLPTVAHFDAAAEFVKPEDLSKMIQISSDVQEHIHWIRQDMTLGFERIILHNVNREQELFINDFGSQVLTAFA